MTPPLALALELIYLRRRTRFISSLQTLIEEDAFTDDFEDLAAAFPEVESVFDLKARLTEIYGNGGADVASDEKCPKPPLTP